MRNDARPMGEALRHEQDIERREADIAPPAEHRDATVARERQSIVRSEESVDQEPALPTNDSTLRTKI